jgi:type II secretory pathway pseudopilin PulG
MVKHNKQDGFSYTDVMIAVTILLVGVMGSAAAITSSLQRSYLTDKQSLAKQIANSALESIFAARDMKRPTSLEGWEQIGNVGSNPVNGVPKGLFLTGFTPIRRDPGLDGVHGTADDACSGTGGCQNYDNSYNNSEIINSFERKIEITDQIVPNRPVEVWGILRRKIDITVRYRINRAYYEEKLSTVITRFE